MRLKFYVPQAKFMASLAVCFFIASAVMAQTTVFTDNFNRAALSPGGTPSVTYSATNSGSGSSATSGSSFLQIANGGTAGRSYVTAPLASLSSPFNSTLDANTGIITWTFNARTTRTNTLSGFDATNYGLAVVLAANGTNLLTANGYAVVYGGSTFREYRLVSFTGGLALNSSLTTITSAAANIFSAGANYVSVRVTYNPLNDQWQLFLRDDGNSAWADPTSGVTTQRGTTTANTTYTNTAMTTFGYLWNYSTGANQNAQLDNFAVTVATTPFVNTSTTSLAFGSQANNTNSLATSFTLTGANLTGFPSNIVATAPAQFQVSADNSTWGSTANIPYTSATLSAPVYVRFSPTTTGAKTGNITFSGGGGSAFPTIALTGTSVTGKTWTGTSGGNWNTAGNWTPSGVPGTTDAVIFNTAVTVNVDINTTVSSITVNSSRAIVLVSSGGGRTLTLSNAGTALDIQTGSSITLNGSTGSGTRSMNLAYSGTGNKANIAGTFRLIDIGEGTSYNATNSNTTVTGTFINDGSSTGTIGTVTSNATTLTFADGGTYEHALDAGTIPTATWATTSTCLVTGCTTTVPGGITQNFGNFTWNSTAQTGALSFAGTLNTVNGNFTVTATNSGSISLGGTGTGDLAIGGNFVQTGGSFIGSSSAARSITVNGNFTVSGGTFNLSSSTTAANTVTFNLKGNYSHTTGTITESGSTTGSGFNFNGTATQTFTSGGTLSNAINYAIANGATVNFGTATITNGSSGAFTLNTGATLITANAAGITSSGATGTIQSTGTRTYNSAANYEFQGAATGTFTTSPTALTVNNLTANNSGNTVTLSQNFSIGNLLTIASGTTLNAGTNLIAGAGLTNAGTGTLRTQNTSSLPFPTGKTWTSNITLDGATAQTLPIGTYNGTTTLNNAAGATLAGNTTFGGDLSLTSGTLSASTFTLILQQNISGSGFINANNAEISLQGTSTQTLNGSNFTGNNISKFTINKTALANTVTLDGSINILDRFNFTKGTLSLANFDITLSSNSTTTAQVTSIVPADIAITYGGTGRFIHQRFIPAPARRAWRLITAPLSNTNSMFDAWQNSGTYTAGQGMFITGPGATGAAGNGLDVSAVNSSSLRLWNTSQTFYNLTNTKTSNVSQGAGTTAANTGYFAFIRGDRTPGLTNQATTLATTTTLSAKGQLQFGDQNFTGLAATAGQFTLIGNPFAAPVDWNLVLANAGTANIQRKIYTWDARLNNVGGYVVLDDVDVPGTFAADPAASTQTQMIQSGQAIFVITQTGGTPTLQFKETNKATTVNSGFLRPATPTTTPSFFRANLYLLETDGNIQIADGSTARFNSSFCLCVDEQDNIKLNNVNETFGFVRNNTFLATERRPEPSLSSADTLFLRLTRSSERSYQFQFIPQNLNPALTPVLIDSYTGSSTPLSNTDTSKINFVINADLASKNVDRFYIVFNLVGGPLPVTFTSIRANAIGNNQVQVEWNVDQQINIRHYNVERSTDGRQFANINQTTATGINGTNAQYQFIDQQLPGNTLYYRIKSTGTNGQAQYSSIAKVQIGKTAPRIGIYPNPVTNGLTALQFNQLAKGNYQINIYGSNGQLMQQKSITHVGGNASFQLNLPNSWAKGRYQLSVTGSNTSISTALIIP